MLMLLMSLACKTPRQAPADCDPELAPGADSQTSMVDGIRIRLAFERCPGTETCFDAVGWLENQSGELVQGQVEVIAPGADLEGAVLDGERTRVRVNPRSTGEVKVSVSDGTRSLRRVALVFDEIHPDLGQPTAVEGLVNSCGWEDSAALSPDGQTLFVQYLPVPIDCIVRLVGGAYCDTAIAPVDAPMRPNMPGAERVDQDGLIHHGCPTVGLDPMPLPVPPVALYSFSRQGDGSYAEPQLISIDGMDGCVSPFGPSYIAEQQTLLFSYDDPFDKSGPQLAQAPYVPGESVSLGRYEKVNGNAELVESIFEDIDVGRPEEVNANPHSSSGEWLWFDDEAGARAIFVAPFEQGQVGDVVQLPTAAFEGDESQPYFDGEHLYFRRGLTLLRAAYLGGGFGQAASWGEPELLLQGQDQSQEAGAMMGAGEPTLAVLDGVPTLNFIYVMRRQDSTADLNVAQVGWRE